MINENKVKFKRALAKVLDQLPVDIEENIPENGPADEVFATTLKVSGSENEVLFLVDNSKEPHEGKYNFIIGVRSPVKKELSAVHAVVGQTRAQILEMLRRENLLNRLCDRLAAQSDKLDSDK